MGNIYDVVNKKKHIIKDFTLNIIASFILIIATQLIVYPTISRHVTEGQYGLILTLMGIINMIGTSFGNPLNNTRILMQPEYDKKNIIGDFNRIFVFLIPVDIILVSFLAFRVYSGFKLEMIGLVLVSLLILFRAYYSASYRIHINFKKILYSNIISSIGYMIGLFITVKTEIWILTFIIGELFACIYIFRTSHIVNEKGKRTELFDKTTKKYMLIMSSTLIYTAIAYMDRFIIYPLIGPAEVSIYNVSSFLGKTAGLIMGPISGVLLTYYAKEIKLTIKQFFVRLLAFSIISLIVFLGIVIVGKPLTGFLYPTIIDKTENYFIIANLASIILMLGSTLMPILLKFCHAKWQPISQTIYMIMYVMLGYFGIAESGLMGFCYAILFVNIFRLFMLIAIVILTLYFNGKGEFEYE